MNLKIVLPTKVFLEQEAQKVSAEAQNGAFVLLPQHIDFAASLVPGILSFDDTQQQEQFIAVDEGLLVKTAQEVLVSVKRAIGGRDLEELERLVEEEFRRLDEIEEKTRAAIARLEVNFRRHLYGSGG
ncbi:MAG: F0F1 ATP synthase subunit epsilon [Cyanobacteria bacterium]|jgi:F-type H+-transporting ATPase subunit epsilon|nr:F0F1 ATP synthase subunit epsilon [Cyanobacteria bacterium GSL.Bin21]